MLHILDIVINMQSKVISTVVQRSGEISSSYFKRIRPLRYGRKERKRRHSEPAGASWASVGDDSLPNLQASVIEKSQPI